MFEAISRSWDITKLCFSVISKDKEILMFPLLAGLFSFIFMVIMVIPAAIPMLLDHTGIGGVSEIALYIVMFLIYLGTAFIATFFNVCVVYTSKIRFEGGDATFMDSIKFALSRLHLIFYWSLVSATVGMILRMLQNAAERAGGIGRLIFSAVIGLIGMAWSIATIFVVPAMVYEGVGPIDAIKSSVATIKRTWGESLIRHFGLGAIQGILNFVGIGFCLIVSFAAASVIGPWGFIFMAPCLVYVVAVNLAFAAANTIFNTALYVYASDGTVPSGFNRELLDNAFRPKKK